MQGKVITIKKRYFKKVTQGYGSTSKLESQERQRHVLKHVMVDPKSPIHLGLVMAEIGWSLNGFYHRKPKLVIPRSQGYSCQRTITVSNEKKTQELSLNPPQSSSLNGKLSIYLLSSSWNFIIINHLRTCSYIPDLFSTTVKIDFSFFLEL